jgi:predicted nucleotidyltransferase
MNSKTVVETFEKRLTKALADQFVAVHWFGSSAENRVQQPGDIDLLLETRAPLTAYQRDQVADVAIDLCAQSGFLLDIHYYTSGEMMQWPYAISPFLSGVSQGSRRQ